jgi:tight adherence protein B
MILVLVFFAVAFAAFGIWLLVGSRDTMSQRLQQRLTGVRQIAEYNLGESIAVAEDKKQQKKEKRREVARNKAFSDIPALQERFGRKRWAERLGARIQQAQLPLTVSTFVLLCALAGFGGAALTVIWQRGVHPVLAPLAFGVFAAAPWFYVTFAASAREKRFSLQFPDALDLLSSCVKSGQSLNAAIQNVSDEMPDPVAEEFRIMADELTFGEDLGKVLRHFSQRMNTEDVQVFCTALQIQKESGGNLSEVLDGLQKTMRERFRILRQVKSLTAQGRLSGWIVGALPIALGVIIYLFNPAYMSDLFTPTGKKLLFAALGLQVLGMFLIRKIVNIKV